MLRLSFLLLPAVVAVGIAGTGCGPVDLAPIPLDSPPVEIDVGTPIGEAIDSSCTDPTAASCATIAALCKVENDGQVCDPVTLPPTFPKEVDVNEDGTVDGDAADLLPDEVKTASEIKVALPVDLGDLLKDLGVTSPDQVKDVKVSGLALGWDENTLTFDAPVLDVYVGPSVDAEDLIDAGALSKRDDFKKIGTIGVDNDEANEGFDVGQVAATTGDVPLTFIDGGNEIFNESLKSLSFTLVAAAPEGQTLTLKEVAGTDPVKVAKPDGAATLKLKAELVYTVDLGGLFGLF